jgi:hypothetical protein
MLNLLVNNKRRYEAAAEPGAGTATPSNTRRWNQLKRRSNAARTK